MKYVFILLLLLFINCAQTKNLKKEANKNITEVDSSQSKNEVLLLERMVEEVAQSRQKENLQITKQEARKKNSTKMTSTETNLGQILYKVPDTMQVMKNYEVIVRISKSQTNVEIRENLGGRVFEKSIKTSNKMQVELIDRTGSCFKLIRVNVEKQLVDSSYTEWKFNVTPLKSGINKLDLVISIFKGDDIKQIVYSDEIYVRSNPKAEIKSFWNENWKWFLEKFLIPLGTWIFGLWLGRKIKTKKKQ